MSNELRYRTSYAVRRKQREKNRQTFLFGRSQTRLVNLGTGYPMQSEEVTGTCLTLEYNIQNKLNFQLKK